MLPLKACKFGLMTLIWVALAGCTFDPSVEDGRLACSISGECPPGYRCLADACYATNAGTLETLNRYAGEWVMGPDANVVTKCEDGGESRLSLADTVMTIEPGVPGASDARVFWLCNHRLRLDMSGLHLLPGNASCSDQSMMIQYTWSATEFDIVTTDGVSALHTARYDRVDRYPDGAAVLCDQIVNAAMTKASP